MGELLPPIGSFRPNEVLAINLGAEGLAKVRAGNYKLVGKIELPEFGLTITRLAPPEGLNTITRLGAGSTTCSRRRLRAEPGLHPYRLGAGAGQ